MIIGSLFNKSSKELERFCFTSQSLYIGVTKYTAWSLIHLIECSSDTSTLKILGRSIKEEYSEADTHLINQILLAKKMEAQKTDEAIEQLREGVYFLSFSCTNIWNTNQTKENTLQPLTNYNHKQTKHIHTDNSYLYVRNHKRIECKILLKEIKRVVVEDCNKNGLYRIIVFYKNVKEMQVLLYSSDFFKVREFVVALEGLILTTKGNCYMGKAQSRIWLLLKRALYLLKQTKGRHNTFKGLFQKLKAKTIANEFGDTHKINIQKDIRNQSLHSDYLSKGAEDNLHKLVEYKGERKTSIGVTTACTEQVLEYSLKDTDDNKLNEERVSVLNVFYEKELRSKLSEVVKKYKEFELKTNESKAQTQSQALINEELRKENKELEKQLEIALIILGTKLKSKDKCKRIVKLLNIQ